MFAISFSGLSTDPRYATVQFVAFTEIKSAAETAFGVGFRIVATAYRKGKLL
jgi:hypothetical protein